MSDRRSNSIGVPGVRLYYETQGKGPLLVMIGPGNSDADIFAPLFPFLAPHFTLVTYDRRGYSRSRLANPEAELTIATHSEDLARLLSSLTSGPVFIFGSSAGAVVGLDFVIHRPDRVRTLIAHEPPVPSVLPQEMRNQLMEGKKAFEETARREGPAAAMKMLAKNVGAPGRGEGTETPQQRVLTAMEKENQRFFLYQESKAIDDYLLDIETLTLWSSKVIIGAGVSSKGFFPYLCSETLAKRLGKALVDFPADHAGFLREPQNFSKALLGLLG